MQNQLTILKKQLPDNIKELKKFILVGEEVLREHKSQLHTIKKIGVAQNYYNAKLYDGQSVAEIVLEAQGKLGKILDGIDKKKSYTGFSKRNPVMPPTITKKESHIAQSIAKDKKEIPTTKDVLEEIQKNKKEARKQGIIEFYTKKAEGYSDNGSVQVIQGDFREVTKQFPDNHFDHIVTDPPYAEEFLPLWTDLSKIAARVLKPSGFCIAYSGSLYLPEVLERMSRYLLYYWILSLRLSAPLARIFPRKVWQVWKPILIFSKEPLERPVDFFRDEVGGSGAEKKLHPWQQSEGEMSELLDRFTHPGDLILDPMAGSGTTLVSCLKNQRRCIGIELEKENVEIIKGRIADTLTFSEEAEAILG